MLNTERDELAEDIRGLGITVIDGPPVDLTEPLAQHLHNLGYRKPRTITTTEELDALPLESVVRAWNGDVWETLFGGWYETCSRARHLSSDIALPATVLYEPEATA